MSSAKSNLAKRIVVIGGGPAGMIAAGTAAKYGARVILLEKNNRLGKKLGITGNGRGNLTNNERDMRSFISAYGKPGKFLYSAITAFSNQDTIRFFELLGVSTKTESDGRVFPKSDKASDIITALHRYLIQKNVQIEFNTQVSQILIKANQIIAVKTDDGLSFPADAVILSTGGKSYSVTGSTGDGFRFAQDFGIKVNPLHPALVPLEVGESWVKKLQGVTLQNVCLTILHNDKIIERYSEDLVFTHFGISGPAALNSSELIGKLLAKGQVFISIDLLPQFSTEQLDVLLQIHFRKYPSREIQNTLVDFFPKKLALIFAQLAEISPQKPVSQLVKSERILLGKTIKDLRVTATHLRPLEEAMVTAGGIAISEINPKTMESKRIQGLYFAGEVIDITGKSGGYNLQMAFSTGYISGLTSAKRNS